MRISDWSSDVCSSDLRQQHERRRRQHGSECAPALGLGIEAEKELRQAVHDEGPAGPPRIAAAAVIGDEGRVDDAPGDDPLADDPGRIEQYQGDKQAEGMRRCHSKHHPCTAGRSEGSRGGAEWVRKCRARWWPMHKKKTRKKKEM